MAKTNAEINKAIEKTLEELNFNLSIKDKLIEDVGLETYNKEIREQISFLKDLINIKRRLKSVGRFENSDFIAAINQLESELKDSQKIDINKLKKKIDKESSRTRKEVEDLLDSKLDLALGIIDNRIEELGIVVENNIEDQTKVVERSNATIKRKLKKLLEEEKGYICPICYNTFTDRDIYKKHVKDCLSGREETEREKTQNYEEDDEESDFEKRVSNIRGKIEEKVKELGSQTKFGRKLGLPKKDVAFISKILNNNISETEKSKKIIKRIKRFFTDTEEPKVIYVDNYTEYARQVLNYVKEDPNCTASEIAKNLNKSKSSISSRLYRFNNDDVVVRSGHPYKYDINPDVKLEKKVKKSKAEIKKEILEILNEGKNTWIGIAKRVFKESGTVEHKVIKRIGNELRDSGKIEQTADDKYKISEEESKEEKIMKVLKNEGNRLNNEQIKEKCGFDISKGTIGNITRRMWENGKIERVKEGRRVYYFSKVGGGIRKKDWYYPLKNLVLQEYYGGNGTISLSDMKKVGFKNFSKKTNKLFEKLEFGEKLQEAIRKDIGEDITFKIEKEGGMERIKLE